MQFGRAVSRDRVSRLYVSINYWIFFTPLITPTARWVMLPAMSSKWGQLSNTAYSEPGLYRCRPWPPKRVFGGTPISTEWFSDIPTNFALPPVRCSRWHKKNGYLDRLKRSGWEIIVAIFSFLIDTESPESCALRILFYTRISANLTLLVWC